MAIRKFKNRKKPANLKKLKEIERNIDAEISALEYTAFVPVKAAIPTHAKDQQNQQALDAYVKKLAKYPVLTRVQEVKLAKTIKKNKELILKECLSHEEVHSFLKNLLSNGTPANVKRVLENVLGEESEDLSEDRIISAKNKILKDLEISSKKGTAHKLAAKLSLTHKELFDMVKTVAPKSRGKDLHAAYAELQEARRIIAECNLRLVFSRVVKFLNRGMDLEDLIQEGNIGLLKAIEKFDYSKGYKFSTYATWWIEQAFGRALANKSRTIRLPVHMLETINKVYKIQRELTDKLGREPTPQEIAKKSALSLEKVQKIMELVVLREKFHFDEPDNEQEEHDKFLNNIEDDTLLAAEDMIQRKNLYYAVRSEIASLTPREQIIIRLRFGIGESVPRTLEEIGNKLKVSKERVRQLESRILVKLKKRLGAESEAALGQVSFESQRFNRSFKEF